MTIGIYGSSSIPSDSIAELARRLGRALGQAGCDVITGACSGLPYLAAAEAARLGSSVHGFSPMYDIEGQRLFTPDDDLSIYSHLEFIPGTLAGVDDIEVRKKIRNVLSTSRCDAGIIIAGRWGTLHELCSLLDYGRQVGILAGSGDLADESPRLVERLGSAPGQVVWSESPEEVVRVVSGSR